MKSSRKVSRAEVTNISSHRLEKCSVPDERFLLFDVTGDAHVEGNSQVLLIVISFLLSDFPFHQLMQLS